jgi:Na+/H+ antiporter NhaC
MLDDSSLLAVLGIFDNVGISVLVGTRLSSFVIDTLDEGTLLAASNFGTLDGTVVEGSSDGAGLLLLALLGMIDGGSVEFSTGPCILLPSEFIMVGV